MYPGGWAEWLSPACAQISGGATQSVSQSVSAGETIRPDQPSASLLSASLSVRNVKTTQRTKTAPDLTGGDSAIFCLGLFLLSDRIHLAEESRLTESQLRTVSGANLSGDVSLTLTE